MTRPTSRDAPHILVVDDERNVRRVLTTLLEQSGFATTAADSAERALELVRSHDPDLVLTDLRMQGMDGIALLEQVSRSFPEIPVVLLTAHGTVENAVAAMKRGAHDFLTKPFDQEQVVAVVRKAVDQGRSARLEVRRSGELELVGPDDDGLVGDGPAMDELRATIRKIAATPSTVLIRGETGTGKELVAEAIHARSDRATGPLIRINCGALPENLIESELFGHERGAFTGADRARPGRFELADGGTLFLDEVGELQPAAQVRLLRVLQDRRVERLGSTTSRQVDVRLLAATHRDLRADVEAGRFREDLFFRLHVVDLSVPPLRDRAEDIPRLVERFLDVQSARLARPRREVSADAMNALMAHDWPGNVRELEHAVERALLLAEHDPMTAADLGRGGPDSVASGGRTVSAEASDATPLKTASRRAAADVERRMIRAALDLTDGNVTHAAERLGLSRRGLQLKMKELGLREA